MTVEIKTDRLALRPWQDSDVDFVFDLYSRWVVQRFIGTEPAVMESRSEAVERLERFKALDHPVHGIWAVTRKEDGLPVGALLLKPIPASGEEPLQASDDVEIGWHFHPDHWGSGFASEAATAVLEHAFDAGLEQVVAVTNPVNEASQSVCRRIGMEHQGQTKKYYNARCELFVIENPAAAQPAK
ncbi:GNAT family N-acetyltransferase [Arthrobacter alpinus]|uniref:GCN5 family acetyltransferase n=1 Tax=Arthrobacter alpinus TaxID=656366 RepID=A0A0S2LZX7_9MICC|nr:GNAT family N-acetyltransferase [Arthrobacter alpinus]ALO67059.1 GCN5 family acetyltransferase [Arthrobacter alpinus]MDD0858019.1 GNAT family N-acetyltransferase [Arthrobacter alpinus]